MPRSTVVVLAFCVASFASAVGDYRLLAIVLLLCGFMATVFRDVINSPGDSP